MGFIKGVMFFRLLFPRKKSSISGFKRNHGALSVVLMEAETLTGQGGTLDFRIVFRRYTDTFFRAY
jgi:hypothetical protein